MKLRIKGNSLRLRVLRSELARLAEGESIVESVRFAPGEASILRYVLTVTQQEKSLEVTYTSNEIKTTISPAQFQEWNEPSQVGIYESIAVGEVEKLEVMIEKDFACLDRNDEDNKDTFANPLQGKIC